MSLERERATAADRLLHDQRGGQLAKAYVVQYPHHDLQKQKVP